MNTLREHNRTIRDARGETLGKVAGVTCDKCGAEMRFEDGEGKIGQRVRCPECGYCGTKLEA